MHHRERDCPVVVVRRPAIQTSNSATTLRRPGGASSSLHDFDHRQCYPAICTEAHQQSPERRHPFHDQYREPRRHYGEKRRAAPPIPPRDRNRGTMPIHGSTSCGAGGMNCSVPWSKMMYVSTASVCTVGLLVHVPGSECIAPQQHGHVGMGMGMGRSGRGQMTSCNLPYYMYMYVRTIVPDDERTVACDMTRSVYLLLAPYVYRRRRRIRIWISGRPLLLDRT